MEARQGSKVWWDGVIERCRAARSAGMTMRQFAASEGITFNALAYRVYEPGRKPRCRRNRRKAQDVQLLPVRVTGSADDGGCAIKSAVPGRDVSPVGKLVEAETQGGVRLRFEAGTDVRYMAGLLLRPALAGSDTRICGCLLEARVLALND